MQYRAIQKYVKSTPKKLRIVRAMVDGLTPGQAVEMLPYSGKRGSIVLEKVIRSAVANARQAGAKEENLRFLEIQINEGPRMKRGRAVAKGMWHPVVKRWSHIRVVLTDDVKTNSKVKNSEVSKKEEKVGDNKQGKDSKPKRRILRKRKEGKNESKS
jgi:large subunit ribosomal protein L22